MDELDWRDNMQLANYVAGRLQEGSWTSDLAHIFFMTGYAHGRKHDDLINVIETAETVSGLKAE